MNIQRIFTGSIAALLLAVSPLAAACDLSCAFPSMNSDCHSGRAESQDSASGGMKMDGMAMAGMTMPKMAGSEEQQAVSAISRANMAHHSIGEMGPRERQACDSGSAVSAKSSRFINSQLHSMVASTETPRPDGALALFRDARDAIALHPLRAGIPLHLNLRV
jgi:hypothetical protein